MLEVILEPGNQLDGCGHPIEGSRCMACKLQSNVTATYLASSALIIGAFKTPCKKNGIQSDRILGVDLLWVSCKISILVCTRIFPHCGFGIQYKYSLYLLVLDIFAPI
jgi:hypothetical protein